VKKVDEMKSEATLSKYFIRILTTTEVSAYEANDDEYINNVDYAWDDSSISFVPQDDNSFYVVKLDLSFNNAKQTKCMAIAVSAEAESFYGETNWVQNNLVSIILLCVAGASLIAIIVLLVVKPKDNDDIDVVDLKEQSAAKAKKTKKNKKSGK
jgi:hypothetical protein